MRHRVEDGLAHGLHGKGGNPQAEEAQRQLLLGIDRAREDLLEPLQDVQQAGLIGVVAGDLRCPSPGRNSRSPILTTALALPHIAELLAPVKVA